MMERNEFPRWNGTSVVPDGTGRVLSQMERNECVPDGTGTGKGVVIEKATSTAIPVASI